MTENSEEQKAKAFIQEQETPAVPTQETLSSASKPIVDAPAFQFQGTRSKDPNEISLGNRLGFQKIPIADLPTQGLFYPQGAEISIRAANTAEIRHWSNIVETDRNVIDDMLNYILERCVIIKFPNGHSSWKDIKEVDRFYLILAVQEYTFIKGENQLQVKVAEGKKVKVTKEMIDYITFNDQIMRYYDEETRCFVLKFKSGKKMPFYIPSVGVVQWLKHYVMRKQQGGLQVDEDFVPYAPFVIGDWKGLNDLSYEQYAIDSCGWSIGELSAIMNLKDMFAETVNPVIKYTDEGGAERKVPVNFQGGWKHIFIIQYIANELD